MEQLRKQLHTDEESKRNEHIFCFISFETVKNFICLFFFFRLVNWVDHSKTLREQGVDENETLLLRRKFFFSDQNIDARDPVQLNLLYVQVNGAFFV